MTARRPLVTQNGLVSELLAGDTLVSGLVSSSTQIVAGSGLSGGGNITSTTQLDVSLSSNASGLIFVGDSLGLDGSDLVNSSAAQSSGNTAIFTANNALASGNNALSVATSALASGNAALNTIPTINSVNPNFVTYTAGSAVVSGYAVGLDPAGRVQSINRRFTDTFNPVNVGSFNQAVDRRGPVLNANSITFSSGNSFLFLYQDSFNSQYLTAKAGAVSGDTVVLGPAYVVESSNPFNSYRTAYSHLENKFVTIYTSSTGLKSVVSVVSGTSTFFGSSLTVTSSSALRPGGLTFCSGNTLAGLVAANFAFISGYVGTLSGMSALFPNPPVNLLNDLYPFQSCIPTIYEDTANRIVYAHTSGVNNDLNITSAIISGSTIIPQFSRVIHTNPFSLLTSAVDQQFMVRYAPSGNFALNSGSFLLSYNDLLYQRTNTYLCQISGNSFLAPSLSGLASGEALGVASTYDPVLDRLVLANSYLGGRINTFSVSGRAVITDPNFSGGFTTNSYCYVCCSYNASTNRVVFGFAAGNISGRLYVSTPLRQVGYSPVVGSSPNVLGIAQSTVSSGSSCVVNLPGSVYTQPSGNFVTGSFYYADPGSSGIITNSATPTLWSGQTPWTHLGKAISASGIMVLKTL